MGFDLSKSPSLARRVFEQLARDNSRQPKLPPPPAPVSPKRRSRKNASNDGRPFQERVIRTANAYQALGVLKLAKVDAPVKFIRGRMVCMENPWPDFVGVLHDRRMITMEAKSTQDERIGFNVRSGGLTSRQVRLLIAWGKAGAISGVLWEVAAQRCGWINWRTIEAKLASGARSLVFEPSTVEPVQHGSGFVEWDFAACFA